MIDISDTWVGDTMTGTCLNSNFSNKSLIGVASPIMVSNVPQDLGRAWFVFDLNWQARFCDVPFCFYCIDSNDQGFSWISQYLFQISMD